MEERVQIRRDGGIAVVTLSRPDKLNALDPAMFAALSEAGESLKAMPCPCGRAAWGGSALLRRAGHGELPVLAHGQHGLPGSRFRTADGEVANEFQKPMHVWKELAVPVIAALTGFAYGGGFQIALGADIRVAAPDARLSVMEIRWGLIPDMGLMTALPRLVRMDVAKDLVLTVGSSMPPKRCRSGS